MPDGTSRFSLPDGTVIFHFMGCSTFSEYTVLAEISLAKINTAADPYQVCLLGCGVSTGWGAVLNNPNWRPRTSVAIWGLGAVGLAVAQAAKMAGATRIYGLDINPDKFELSKEFGVTECHNPLDSNAKDWLLSKEKWGIDFTYDCTGNVMVMRDALEAAHRGFGESCVIGVAAAGKELATRPFQLITGRCWKGTAFGGWKSRQDVPKLVNKVLLSEMPIEKFITHEFVGLEKVGDLVHALHEGNCLRGVLRIQNDYVVPPQGKVQVVGQQMVHGGVLKTVKHWSEANQCDMKFNIFLPEDSIRLQRGKKQFPVLYFLSGLTCDHTNFADKSGFAKFAKKHGIVVVMPDTSPRGLDFPEVNEGKYEAEPYAAWTVGYGAGHYCDATGAPWSKNFNMYSYVTKELPALVNDYFPVDPNVKSIFGHSMGGNGALVCALRNSTEYKSVSAFAPISNPAESGFANEALRLYFGNAENWKEQAAQYSCTELIKARAAMGLSPKEICPPALVDMGTVDTFEKLVDPELLKVTAAKHDLNLEYRWQEGYNHFYNFINSFIEDHINFHALYLKSA